MRLGFGTEDGDAYGVTTADGARERVGVEEDPIADRGWSCSQNVGSGSASSQLRRIRKILRTTA